MHPYGTGEVQTMAIMEVKTGSFWRVGYRMRWEEGGAGEKDGRGGGRREDEGGAGEENSDGAAGERIRFWGEEGGSGQGSRRGE